VTALVYRAPEILLTNGEYGKEVDIWALGCIFAEMFLGRAIFQGDSTIDQISKIFEIMGTPNEKTWPGINRILKLSKVDSLKHYEPTNLSNLFQFRRQIDPLALD